MSHEIRTPLNGVVAMADALARSDLGPREREMVDIVRSSSDATGRPSSAASVKLSIRMTNEEALQLAAGARASGLSRGAYLAGLIAIVFAIGIGRAF